MYKVLSIMQKPPGMSLEAFRQWATVEHPRLAHAIPGLQKYVVNVVVSDDPAAEFHAAAAPRRRAARRHLSGGWA